MPLRSSYIALMLALLGIISSGCARTPGTPITYYYGTPWTEASVNGVGGYFLVDTGASMSVMDAEFARRAGIVPESQETITATTGSVVLAQGYASEIELAGRSHLYRMVSIQDLAAFRAPGGRRQSGLIGSDFFLDYTMIIDRDRGSLALAQQRAPIAGGLTPHRLELDGGLPTIELFFGEISSPVWAVLDTGSGYAEERFVYIEIGATWADRLLGNRLGLTSIETVTVVSLAGERTLGVYEFGPVRILGKQFQEVRLVVHDHGDGAFADKNQVFITGSLLNQFSRLEIDYPARLVWARPRLDP